MARNRASHGLLAGTPEMAGLLARTPEMAGLLARTLAVRGRAPGHAQDAR